MADAKAEAEIKVADAARRQSIAVSDAQRESSLVTAANAAKVAEANMDGEEIAKAAHRISIVDVGGNGQGLAKVSGMAPQFVFQVLSQLEALGLDVKGLLKLLKIDPSGLETLLAGVKPGVAAAPEAGESAKATLESALLFSLFSAHPTPGSHRLRRLSPGATGMPP